MKKTLFLLALPVLAACSSTPDKSAITQALDITPYLHPYRMDVRQGNLVTQDMAAQLRPGLSKDQVRFILGTPLLTDIFHADRWDYVYRLQKGNGEVQQRRLVVYFAEDKLARVGGDVVGDDPSALAVQAKPAARVIEIKAPVAPEKSEGDVAAKPVIQPPAAASQ